MCVKTPTVTPPSLGGGLSLEPPALPGFTGDLSLCCKQVSLSFSPPPIFPAGVFTAGVAVALNSVLAPVQAYLDALIPDCPLE